MSVSPVIEPDYYPVGKTKPDGYTSPSGLGLTAAQMRNAYGLGAVGSANITFGGIQGDGTGQTIALVDEYNDPNIATDLATFDAAEGLLSPPSFSVVNQNGQASPLPSNSATSGSNDWSSEESLDVEWSHVIAPGASIVLVECTNLYAGDAAAANLPGVSVVSNSWGGGESGSETGYDSYFTTPSGHANVAFFASTGDSGAQISYPAESPNVIAVGGTAVTLSGTNWSSETTWSSGGGGTSSYEAQPSYQAGTITATHRETPDISMDASPNTGVPIVDSWDNSASAPWSGVWGGTSLSSPMTAALVAIADQGRAAEGLGTLTTAQAGTRLYQLSKANFHDITTGSNGHAAVVGYDEATGIGSPIANVLVPDLAGTATITGRIFADNLGTGTYQAGETVFANQTVYLDLNNDGTLDNSEPSTTTNAQGIYTFTDEPAGGTVRLSSPTITGYAAIPNTSAGMTYGATNTINLTYFPLSVVSTVPSATYTLQTDSTNTYDQIYANGTLIESVAKSVLTGDALTFSVTGAGDTFTVNATNGSPLPSGGISVSGPSTGVPLTIIGTATGVDIMNVTSSTVTFDSVLITTPKIALLTLNPGAGTDSLTVSSGSATVAPQTTGGGILTRNFANISIAAGSSVLFSTAPIHTDRTLVETTLLSVQGQLDLGGNDMIVHSGSLSAINALLTTGYSNGLWTGQGIASSTAAGNTTHLTALGAIQNTLYGSGSLPRFDGSAPLSTDVLIKYTYYGDTNLDGKVDGSDYARIDNTAIFSGSGWYNGDFNDDSSINGTDYTLIDNAFNMQGATPLAQPSDVVAGPAGSSAKSTGQSSTAVPSTLVQPAPSSISQTGTNVEQSLTQVDLLDGLAAAS